MRRLAVAVGLAAVAAAALAGAGSADAPPTPFYVVPGPNATHECGSLAFCYGITGLWVSVPAHGQATYLFGCPERAKSKGAFLLGGTDARTSSKHVRVWYEGKLGGPITIASGQTEFSSGLLFHAVTDDGKPGSFQPVLGCINLRQASKRATTSARRVAPPKVTLNASPKYHARVAILEPGWDRPMTVSCRRSERLVGSWSAFAFGTLDPPKLPPGGAGTVALADVGNTVSARVRTKSSVQYLIRVQVGAVCEP